MTNKITIYTDGAARGNPGSAGWGAVFVVGKKHFELGGRSCHATNNQMELTAPIEALKYLKNLPARKDLAEHKISARQDLAERQIEIISDSKYVILGITEWIFNWQKNNWRNAAKKPVLNQELWEELYDLTKNLKIKWSYVKGHSGDKWNDRVDEIATTFADDNPVELKNAG